MRENSVQCDASEDCATSIVVCFRVCIVLFVTLNHDHLG